MLLIYEPQASDISLIKHNSQPGKSSNRIISSLIYLYSSIPFLLIHFRHQENVLFCKNAMSNSHYTHQPSPMVSNLSLLLAVLLSLLLSAIGDEAVSFRSRSEFLKQRELAKQALLQQLRRELPGVPFYLTVSKQPLPAPSVLPTHHTSSAAVSSPPATSSQSTPTTSTPNSTTNPIVTPAVRMVSRQRKSNIDEEEWLNSTTRYQPPGSATTFKMHFGRAVDEWNVASAVRAVSDNANWRSVYSSDPGSFGFQDRGNRDFVLRVPYRGKHWEQFTKLFSSVTTHWQLDCCSSIAFVDAVRVLFIVVQQRWDIGSNVLNRVVGMKHWCSSWMQVLNKANAEVEGRLALCHAVHVIFHIYDCHFLPVIPIHESICILMRGVSKWEPIWRYKCCHFYVIRRNDGICTYYVLSNNSQLLVAFVMQEWAYRV